jgi:hypothetical protein
MMHSLEVRAPFLDIDLVDCACGAIRGVINCRGGQTNIY